MNNNYQVTLTSGLNNTNNHFIVFSIKNNLYAIKIENVMEVINLPEIEIPAKAPESIIGMFNYNGLMIKAVDLCPFLGFETSSFSISNRLIIAIADGNCFAIHTETIENIIQLDKQNIQTIPFEMDNSILKNVYKSENRTINIIDIDTLNKLISETHSKESNINYFNLFPSDEKSQQILKLRANQNKTAQEVFSFPFDLNSANKYILFTLDNNNYYLDLKYVKEFTSIKRLNITKLPYTQDFVKGIINLKGEFIVVIDLKHFLNNSNNDSKEGNKLIIAEGKNFNIAFLVDDIKLIKNIQRILQPNIYSVNSAYIYSEFMEEGELYSILNFEKIINDERLYINIE